MKQSWMLILSAVLLMAQPGHSANSEKVQQKAGETADAAAEYARNSREEFQKKMRENLTDIEADIADLKSRASVAASDARTSLMKQIDQLEAKRDQMKSSLDKASVSSGRAWERMKEGVERAWSEVKVAYNRAANEFESEEQEAEAKKPAKKKKE